MKQKFTSEKEFILACKTKASLINLEKFLKIQGIDPNKYIKKKKTEEELYQESIQKAILEASKSVNNLKDLVPSKKPIDFALLEELER
ncbi:MAG: hypothetical protein IPK55_11710 [Streptococcus sp.]|nr:hypothetical protein [Streptococcus sp.]